MTCTSSDRQDPELGFTLPIQSPATSRLNQRCATCDTRECAGHLSVHWTDRGACGGLHRRDPASHGGWLIGGMTSKVSALPATMRQRTNLAVAALNAEVGDRLCDANSSLAIRMALRSDGRDVRIRRDRLEAAYPAATPKLAVFLHGLAETENSWRNHADDHDGDGSVVYDSRLVAAGGNTTRYLRYNTGLHISDSGKRLSDLLTAAVSAWPAARRGDRRHRPLHGWPGCPQRLPLRRANQ